MTIKELILCALEYEPLQETVIQRVLLRILEMLNKHSPKELPEPKEDVSL